MNLVSSFMLFISGGMTVASVMMSKIGYERSILTRRAAAMMSGVGVGIGCGVAIYYGVSNGDLIGSIITGIVVGFTVYFASYIVNRPH